MVVAGGVALGEGDMDEGVSAPGNSHWEELDILSYLTCMHAFMHRWRKGGGAPGAEAMQINVVNMTLCHYGLILVS